MEESSSLATVWSHAERERDALSTTTPFGDYFAELAHRINQLYGKCKRLADNLSLFSVNEDIDEVATGDLKYLQIDQRIAESTEKLSSKDRKAALLQVRDHYRQFLERLDDYGLLSAPSVDLLKALRSSPDTFTTTAVADPTQRRNAKIERYKLEKELGRKLSVLEKDPRLLQGDEETARQLYLAQLDFLAHMTFQALESHALELQILKRAPAPSHESSQRQHREETHSERLDVNPYVHGRGRGGPLLNAQGQPLQPFTILGKREQLAQGVFRPGHNLPTMTIDEYLEEERKRGGIIEDGGAASMQVPGKDEDSHEVADAETMKARQWDEYAEANPRGAGNTINRG